eukprot:CAMPEP_0172442916 /NCGR_PEP_ID=MMETSP1065-20121228/3263_1 /TAXON_ID=265537 /ORGANISM="Amphiprora paludosa, Strain CCMP125" /LENGTH=630 /DNA_ID=CAMNT_0013192963 /DNA_START=372 /DNA_END=2264 /DNA_ORIENTATION=-
MMKRGSESGPETNNNNGTMNRNASPVVASPASSSTPWLQVPTEGNHDAWRSASSVPPMDDNDPNDSAPFLQVVSESLSTETATVASSISDTDHHVNEQGGGEDEEQDGMNTVRESSVSVTPHVGGASFQTPPRLLPVPLQSDLFRAQSRSNPQFVSEAALQKWQEFARINNMSPPQKINISLKTVKKRADELLKTAGKSRRWCNLFPKQQTMMAFALKEGFHNLLPNSGSGEDRNNGVRVFIEAICDQSSVSHAHLYNYVRKEGDKMNRSRDAKAYYEQFLEANPCWTEQDRNTFLIYREYREIRIVLRLQEAWSMICAFNTLATAIYLSSWIRNRNNNSEASAGQEDPGGVLINVTRLMRQRLSLREKFESIFCSHEGFSLQTGVEYIFKPQGKGFNDVTESCWVDNNRSPRYVHSWASDNLQRGPLFTTPFRLPKNWCKSPNLATPTEFEHDEYFYHFLTIIGVRFVPNEDNEGDPGQVIFAVQDSLENYPFREVSLQVFLDGGVDTMYAFHNQVMFPSADEFPELTNLSINNTFFGGASPLSKILSKQEPPKQPTPLSEWERKQYAHWFCRDDHVLPYNPDLIDNENPDVDEGDDYSDEDDDSATAICSSDEEELSEEDGTTVNTGY